MARVLALVLARVLAVVVAAEAVAEGVQVQEEDSVATESLLGESELHI
jgi:hypothetical protein